MDSRLIFLPHVRMRWDDERHDDGHLIGLVSLALDQGDRKIRPRTVDADETAARQDPPEELSKKNL